MTDDKSKTQPVDDKLINISEDYEVRYWAGKFKCDREELAAAVKAVGNSAMAVEKYLDRTPRS